MANQSTYDHVAIGYHSLNVLTNSSLNQGEHSPLFTSPLGAVMFSAPYLLQRFPAVDAVIKNPDSRIGAGVRMLKRAGAVAYGTALAARFFLGGFATPEGLSDAYLTFELAREVKNDGSTAMNDLVVLLGPNGLQTASNLLRRRTSNP